MSKRILSCAAGLAGLAAFTAISLAPAPAKAWVVIGLPPVVLGAPAPYYYPPPPAYYYPPGYAYGYGYGYPPPAPQQYTQAPPPAQRGSQVTQDNRPYGSMCYAGVYNCAAQYGARQGDVCSCAGIGAPSYGRVN